MSVVGKIHNELENFVDLTEKLQPVIGAPGAGQFRTYIKNRTPIPNLAKDLSCKWGTQRIDLHQLVESVEESADTADGVDQRVWHPTGDKFHQVRLVGNNWQSYNNNVGTFLQTTITGQFAEVVFYGTGLNLLTISDPTDLRVTVDGGSESANICPYAGAPANPMGGQYWNLTQVFPVCSGLTEGLHTVKIRYVSGLGGGLTIYGFEFLNESANMKVLPGTAVADGVPAYNPSVQSVPLKTGFSSGTLGTKGGHVVVYINKDGTIGKSVTPTDATAQYGNTATTHANEEVSFTNFYRLYGRNDGVDFSYRYGSNLDLAGTLDDNCHALCGVSVSPSNEPGVALGGTNKALTITFKGTGLDILRYDGISSPGTDILDVYIDGVLQTPLSDTGDDRVRWEKICSGLPYGTHVVRLLSSTNVNYTMYLRSIRTWVPKKPSIPAGATEIGRYFVNADYAYVGTQANPETGISAGVVRHSSLREVIYNGGNWILNGVVPTFSHGRNVYENSGSAGGKVRHYFYGTGVELNVYGGGAQKDGTLAYIDGTLATSANFPAAVFNVNHSAVYTASTATLDLTPVAGGIVNFSISNLTLGWHYVEFETTNTSGFFQVNAFDVITPIDAIVANDEFCIQASFARGGCQLADTRRVSLEKGRVHAPMIVSKAQAVISYATKNQGGANVPFEDMRVPIKSPGAWFRIDWSMLADVTSAGTTPIILLEINDGVNGDGNYTRIPPIASGYFHPSQSMIIWLPKGEHYAYVSCNPGTSVVRRVESCGSLSAIQIP